MKPSLSYPHVFLSLIPVLFCLWLVSLFSGCGTDSSPPLETSQPDSGAAAFSLRWHKSRSALPESESIPSINAISDCAEAGVVNIFCSIWEEPDTFLLDSSIWACTAGRGRIEGIPVGEDRQFVCLGLDNAEGIVHSGRISGIDIRPNETTPAGFIDFYRFVTLLTTPEDGAVVTTNTFSLNWDSVPNAHRYLVQIAETRDFENMVEEETTPRTTYMPGQLEAGRTYFWRVRTLDLRGNTGTASFPRAFTTTPGITCRPPALSLIGNQIVPEGEPLAFTVTATDPDIEAGADEQLSFSSSPLPTGASFDAESGRFQWDTRQGDQGYYVIVFTVCDTCPDAPLCDSEEIIITVGNICRPPVLEEIGPRQGFEGEDLIFTINASDPDPESQLTYRAANRPSGARFDEESRTFSWQPDFGDAGNYQVNFEVCDDCPEGPLCDSEEVSITVGDICRPPDLAAVGNRQIDAEETLVIRLSANDPDNDSTLTYSAGAPFDQYLNPQTGVFRWTPIAEAAGESYRVEFEVCDDCAQGPLCDTTEMTITVGFGCRPPTFNRIGDQDANVGEELLLQLSANDPDTGDTLTYSAAAPFDQNIDPQTGEFRWTPPAEAAGETYTVEFEVCDDCPAGRLCDMTTIEIRVADVCRPPVLEDIAPRREAVLYESLNFFVVASDPDTPESALDYRIENRPEGAFFTPREQYPGRVFAWTPDGPEDVGEHQVTFSVCDDCTPTPMCAETTVTIVVNDPSPEISPPQLRSPQDGTRMDNGCDNNYDIIEWNFSWSQVANADGYQIQVFAGERTVLERTVESPNHTYRCDPEFQENNCYFQEETGDFTWRIRAGAQYGETTIWSDWSPIGRFQLEPVNSDCPENYEISLDRLNPPPPNYDLDFDDRVDVNFSYNVSGDQPVRIFLLPYTNGGATPYYGVSGSPEYAPGRGTGTGFFTIREGDDTVAVGQLRFLITNSDQSREFRELFFPVDYHFSEPEEGPYE